MTMMTQRYFALLRERLDTVANTQSEAIEKAAAICADAIAADRLVHTFGTGHGSFAAMEMFPRTGTVTGFHPIVESSMISFHRVLGDGGARQYRFIHGQEGYGKAILASHHLEPDDAMLIFSHSGLNAVTLDIAVGAKERGMKVIGVTSIPHSSSTPSRHSCGKRLYEIADVVVDTGVPKADASVPIDGFAHPVGATSTSISIAIGQAINAATAERLVARGIEPYVMVNPNTLSKAEADKQNDRNYTELWRRLRMRGEN